MIVRTRVAGHGQSIHPRSMVLPWLFQYLHSLLCIFKAGISFSLRQLENRASFIMQCLAGFKVSFESRIVICKWYFSFCLTSHNLEFLQNRTKFFSKGTSFCQFYNMASSGLKKMLILIILYTHESVSVNMCPVIFPFRHNILINFDGRCYAIFV